MAGDFQEIFAVLKAIYAAHEAAGIVTRDEPGAYFLATMEVREKDGYRTAFGGVEIRKSYVSAHLMPVYTHPELLDGAPESLRKRMQGKSCFNFKSLDAELLREFEALAEKGFRRFEQDGRYSPPGGAPKPAARKSPRPAS